DQARLKQAIDCLSEARVLAQAFGLDPVPIDVKMGWVAQRLQGGGGFAQAAVQEAPPTPAGSPGEQLLQQARTAFKAGRNAEARRLAEEAFDPKYGVQPQAEMMLRGVEIEEFEQKRLDSERAFAAAYDAYLRKEYRQAQTLLSHLDERLLSEDKQRRLREIALDANMQPKGGHIAQVQQIQAQKIDAQPPGYASVGDQKPGFPGAKPAVETGGLDAYKTMLQLEYDKATKEGLMAQREAQKRAEGRDFDGALEVLKAYNARLGDTGLNPDQVA